VSHRRDYKKRLKVGMIGIGSLKFALQVMQVYEAALCSHGRTVQVH
jgi:hypothetical protein